MNTSTKKSQLYNALDEVERFSRDDPHSTIYFYMKDGVPKTDVKMNNDGTKMNFDGRPITCHRSRAIDLISSITDEINRIEPVQIKLF
jgi:hypothetical protein